MRAKTLIRAALAAMCLGLVASSAVQAQLKQIEPQVTASALAQPSGAGAQMACMRAWSQYDWPAMAHHCTTALRYIPSSETLPYAIFKAEAALGRVTAVPLARKLAARPDGAKARLYMAGHEFIVVDRAAAEAMLSGTDGFGTDQLAAVLGRAWMRLDAGDGNAALALVDGAKPDEKHRLLVRLHRAMIAELAGRRDEALRDYVQLSKEAPTSWAVALAHAGHLAHSGDRARAGEVVATYLAAASAAAHPLLLDVRDRLANGSIVAPRAAHARYGLAALFTDLSGGETADNAIFYLQISLGLVAQDPATLGLLAHRFTELSQHALAIEQLDRLRMLPGLALVADLRRAESLFALDRIEEATALLDNLATVHPADARPLELLGRLLRRKGRHDAAAAAFSRLITRTPKSADWEHRYRRALAYHAANRWPEAEADLRQALALASEEPRLLNTLGFGLLEQKRNSSEAMALIEKAVSKDPDAGDFIDSLGWAHFQQGNHTEALRHIERAMALSPDDPTIADHLGDVLGKLGRTREAVAYWSLALALEPGPELAALVNAKLDKKSATTTAAPPAAAVPARATEAVKPEDCIEVAVLAYCDSIYRMLGLAEPNDDAELRKVRAAMQKLQSESAAKLKGRTSDPMIFIDALAELQSGKDTSRLIFQCAQTANAIKEKVKKYCRP